jgi:hypothetical protein
MNRERLTTWIQRLEHLTRGVVLPSEPREIERYIGKFSDENGDRRHLDGPLLARVLGGSQSWFVRLDEDDVATALMRAAGRQDIGHVMKLIRPSGGTAPLPLVAEQDIATLETETEKELASVHAVGALALTDPGTELRPRLASAVRWLMAEIQPDNATHRPWAVHAFAWAAATMPGRDAADAEMYAQTLAHNAVVAASTRSGAIDRFSLILLRDALQVLQRLS